MSSFESWGPSKGIKEWGRWYSEEEGLSGQEQSTLKPTHIKFHFPSHSSQGFTHMIPEPKHFPVSQVFKILSGNISKPINVQNPQPLMLIEKKRTCPADILLCHCLRMLVAWVTQGEVKSCLLPTSPKTRTTNFLLCFFMLLSTHVLVK